MLCSIHKKCLCFECKLPRDIFVGIKSRDPKTFIPLMKNLQLEEYDAEKLALLLLEAGRPLHHTIYFNNLKITKFMIKHGCCIDSFDIETKNRTALHVAVIDSDIESVKFLLEQGANQNVTDVFGFTPLLLTAMTNNLEVLDLLLQYGAASENFANIEVFQSFLFFTGRDEKYIKKFLKYKFNLMAQDLRGNTPLHYMSRRTDGLFVDLLEKLDLNVNIQNESGKTPLHLTKCVGYVKFLLKKGADVNIKNQLEETPLIKALNREDVCPEIIELLLNHGIVLDERLMMALESVESRQDNKAIRPILARVALTRALDTSIQEKSPQLMSQNVNMGSYFNDCNQEIQCMRTVRISENFKVTYFNILVDTESEFRNYARNDELINSFDKIDLVLKFPIYGETIKQRFREAIDKQSLIQKAVDVLGKSIEQLNSNSNTIENIVKFLKDDDLKLLIM